MTAEQLKNSILQMAVQGKLVPQDPNDEPASELIKRIREEKEQLIKEGKIKKEKNPSYIFRGEDNIPYEKVGKNEPVSIADELPFEIPESWEWVRFKDLVNYSMGKTPPRKEDIYWSNPEYKWVSISDMKDGETIYDTKEMVNQYALENTFRGNISPAGSLLMSFKLTVGKVSILGMDAFHNEAIISIYPYVDDNRTMTKYLFEVLPLLSQEGDTKTAIKGKTLNSSSLDALFIPVPPLSEQERIVQKLDQLKSPIQQYAASEDKANDLYVSFPDKLRKSILQEAVMGKLVPQDENDKPASVLLDRIREEKQRLISEGKLKKEKHESIIYRRDNSHYEKLDGVERCIDEEIPFEIPDSWEWTRLNNCLDVRDGTHDTPKYVTDGVPLVTSKNLRNGSIDFSNVKLISRKDHEAISLRSKVDNDDILFAMIGSIGNPVLYRGNIEFSIKNMALVKHVQNGMYMEFVYWWLFLSQDVMKKQASGGVQSFVSLNYLRNYYIPVPPYDEQKRIAKKIRKLFIICDNI